jgi:methylated-DNA-protein-cysteine methyltransferase-like protein
VASRVAQAYRGARAWWAPPALRLPWHRVLAAGGRIAFPKGSRAYLEQRRRLRAEGVSVVSGRVVKSAAFDLDALLWKPK